MIKRTEIFPLLMILGFVLLCSLTVLATLGVNVSIYLNKLNTLFQWVASQFNSS